MKINITNRIGQHKIPQRITEKQNTDLFYHTSTCMAHRNCLPPRAAGVNYWFFLLAHMVVDVGIKQNAKCEMLLHKINGKMNMQNCGFSAKLRWWQHAPRLTATAVITDSRHRFSKR